MPKKKYFLRYRHTIIGVFYEENDRLSYKTIPEVAESLPFWSGYPLGLIKRTDFSDSAAPIAHFQPSEKMIRHWLSERVFQENKQAWNESMKFFRVTKYNVWEIAKRSKGITLNDDYWFSDDLTDDYAQVHPRAQIRTWKSRPVRRLKKTVGGKTIFAKISPREKAMRHSAQQSSDYSNDEQSGVVGGNGVIHEKLAALLRDTYEN